MLTQKQLNLINYIKGTRATAPEVIADANPQFYNPWVYGEAVSIGDRRRDEYNGLVYEVYASAGDNLCPPHEVLNIWRRAWDEEWPDWVQPTGAHDAYILGAKVVHKGDKWVSDVSANIWEPGVYGWTKQ